MTRTTDQWEALLDGLEGVTLAAGHETFPAFDDDPDQSPVSIPCVRVKGMATWSTIGAPSNLIPVLAASIDSVAEVVRLRRAITDLRDDYLAHIATREFFVDQVSGLVVEIREDVDDYYGTAADDLARILEGETNE